MVRLSDWIRGGGKTVRGHSRIGSLNPPADPNRLETVDVMFFRYTTDMTALCWQTYPVYIASQFSPSYKPKHCCQRRL